MMTVARGMKMTPVINASQVRTKNGDRNEYTSNGVVDVLPSILKHVL